MTANVSTTLCTTHWNASTLIEHWLRPHGFHWQAPTLFFQLFVFHGTCRIWRVWKTNLKTLTCSCRRWVFGVVSESLILFLAMQAICVWFVEPVQVSFLCTKLYCFTRFFRSTEEVIAILNKEDSVNDENIEVWASKLSLSRLKLAIKYEQKMVSVCKNLVWSFWYWNVANMLHLLCRSLHTYSF